MEWSYVLWFCVAYYILRKIEKAFIAQSERIQQLEARLGLVQDGDINNFQLHGGITIAEYNSKKERSY